MKYGIASFICICILQNTPSALAFVPSFGVRTRGDVSSICALPTPEESAKALTEYMAKAHEEKIKATKAIEDKYKDRIKELEDKLANGEAPAAAAPAVQSAQESNSYQMPASNKALTEKVEAYQTFLSNYVVKANLQKYQAVKEAEDKLIAKYEAIIADLTKSS